MRGVLCLRSPGGDRGLCLLRCDLLQPGEKAALLMGLLLSRPQSVLDTSESSLKGSLRKEHTIPGLSGGLRGAFGECAPGIMVLWNIVSQFA